MLTVDVVKVVWAAGVAPSSVRSSVYLRHSPRTSSRVAKRMMQVSLKFLRNMRMNCTELRSGMSPTTLLGMLTGILN